MSKLAHLHLHTQYSLLDGVNKIPDVLQQAAKFGQPAIAITDHGNMHGALEFYEAAKKAEIKPIIGCEVYIAPQSRFDKKMRPGRGQGANHLTLLAKNKTGYHNLCRLVSLAYKEGFYFKPRIDHELLQRYHEGLIVLSGCLASEVAEAVEIEDQKQLESTIEFYAKTFGDDYYLEVQPHQIPEQRKLNLALTDYAKSKGINLVATTDCHYPSPDHHFAQEVLMCISTGKLITDPDRIRHEGVKLHLKTYEEMQQEFGSWKYTEEALSNTVAIAAKCELNLKNDKYFMPKYEAPAGKTLEEEFADLSRTGLEERLKFIKPDATQKKVYHARLEEEIELISRMGFVGYFLVVADFINWAKENSIPVGPGRGSAAGSLIAYALRITEIDPIVNKLLFERFLNPERISMPDIDVDFCINGRDQVIKYVVEKYGKENVSQIATFGTLKAKAAIKDVGRAMGLSFAETNRIAELIPPPRQGFDFSLSESIKMEPRLKDYADGEGRQLIDLALKLEGLNRHSSTHAAGVVIGDQPLMNLLPMMVDKDGNDVTQFSMKYVEKVGLVKFDFLGLKTLTVIHSVCDLILKSKNIKIDPNRIPLDDTKTFKMLCVGHTTGVFQLESSGITDVTMRLKPSCFDDLVATIALYRPGPLDAGMVDHYINRKHGREPVVYLHPLMKNTLQDTYGIMVYQEQIMQLAQTLSGYSLGEADLLRRAMGKKVPEEMAQQRVRFVTGSIKNKIDEKIASEIFDQMETFARYGFNRSHSAAYAMILYQTAYLRAHHPVEFMAGLMSHEIDDSDKVLKNMTECRKQKITVLPPDVNASISGFSVQKNNIRFGLSAVKGIGEKAIQDIIRARAEGGEFKSLEDLVSRVDLHSVNKRVLENLIFCGALDVSGISRCEMHARMEDVMRAGQALQKQANSNQISLFGGAGATLQQTIPQRNSNRPEWPINQKLNYERDALGFYLSGHPVEKFMQPLKRAGALSISDIKKGGAREKVKIGGVVTALKLKNTKKGNRYASLIFEDLTGTIEAIVWPDTYLKVAQVLHGTEPVVASGRIDANDERSTLIIDNIETMEDAFNRKATQGILRLKESDDIQSRKQKILEIFSKYNGTVPVKIIMEMKGQDVVFIPRNERKVPVLVVPSEKLCDEIEQVFGRPVMSFM